MVSHTKRQITNHCTRVAKSGVFKWTIACRDRVNVDVLLCDVDFRDMGDAPTYRFPTLQRRIVDVVPAACIITLLCCRIDYVGISLLQGWLWLRHPRTTSRYAIAVVIVLLWLVVLIGSGVFTELFDQFVYGLKADLDDEFNEIMYAAIVFASTGLVPITYRLISRRSLRMQADELAGTSKSRGSIADILCLTAFFATVFVLLRQDNISSDTIGYTMLSRMTIGIAASICTVLALHLLAQVRGMSIIASAAVVWLISGSVLIAAGQVVRYLEWNVRVAGHGITWWGYMPPRFQWFDETDDWIMFATSFIVIIGCVLIFGRCGVTLAEGPVSTSTGANSNRK